eukprot:9473752-Pyramimonas_sp.AAC.2
MSNAKFVAKFEDLIRTTFKDVAAIDSAAILKEHKTSSTTTIVNEAANQLIFDILSTICEDTAYMLISPYNKADDENANDRDGRRAFFALMRVFFPKTTNSAGNAEQSLRDFKFTLHMKKNIEQRTEFRKLTDDYGDARGHPMTRVEKYNAAILSINAKEFKGLKTIIDFLPKHANHDTEWLICKITAFVENNDTTDSESDNKGVAFGITTTPAAPTIEERLEAIIPSLPSPAPPRRRPGAPTSPARPLRQLRRPATSSTTLPLPHASTARVSRCTGRVTARDWQNCRETRRGSPS